VQREFNKRSLSSIKLDTPGIKRSVSDMEMKEH
jgi:hypothetical protein